MCASVYNFDKECWFGEQYSNLPTEFARNAKRGAPKKQTGRLTIILLYIHTL